MNGTKRRDTTTSPRRTNALTFTGRLLPKCSEEDGEGGINGGRFREEADVQDVRARYDRVGDGAAKVFQSVEGEGESERELICAAR